jgi:hypothetical protein
MRRGGSARGAPARGGAAGDLSEPRSPGAAHRRGALRALPGAAPGAMAAARGAGRGAGAMGRDAPRGPRRRAPAHMPRPCVAAPPTPPPLPQTPAPPKGLLPAPPPPALPPALHPLTSTAAVAAAAAPPLAQPQPAAAHPPPLPARPPLHRACRARPPAAAAALGLSLDAAELLASVQDLEELGSHTELPRLACGAQLHGNWAVTGPAVVRRVGRSLRALLRGGAWVSLGAALDQVVTAESLSSGDAGDGTGYADAAPGGDAPPPPGASFELHGTLVELSGPFKLLLPSAGTPTAHPDGGRMVVTVPKLDEEQCILLLPGGRLSHPLCAVPPPPPPPPRGAATPR